MRRMQDFKSLCNVHHLIISVMLCSADSPVCAEQAVDLWQEFTPLDDWAKSQVLQDYMGLFSHWIISSNTTQCSGVTFCPVLCKYRVLRHQIRHALFGSVHSGLWEISMSVNGSGATRQPCLQSLLAVIYVTASLQSLWMVEGRYHNMITYFWSRLS